MLAVDPAQPVATAAEGEPDGQPRRQQRLDDRMQRRAHHGEALDHHQIGRLARERTLQQPQGLRPVRAVDVGVDREGDGHVALASLLGDRLACEAHAAHRGPHPVPGQRAVVGRAQQPLRVGRDHIAARPQEAPMGRDDLGCVGGIAAAAPPSRITQRCAASASRSAS